MPDPLENSNDLLEIQGRHQTMSLKRGSKTEPKSKVSDATPLFALSAEAPGA